jgi:hypothetical protein
VGIAAYVVAVVGLYSVLPCHCIVCGFEGLVGAANALFCYRLFYVLLGYC